MTQPLKSINLIAPAFKGINTEDSALAQDPSFAEVADHAVIDRRGRLAARKGLDVTTTNKTVLGSGKIRAIKEFRDSGGNSVVFSVGNNKIMSGTTTLVDETPGAYTVSSDNWKMVNFNDAMYFFQKGHEPLHYSNATGSVGVLSGVAGAAGVTSAMYGNEVLAAYGRLWTADISNNTATIYWSDLLQGHVWTGGSSGSIDITNAWPNGYDEIVALAAHNGFLVIFGKNSIITYSGASSPSSMTLADTVFNVGCVDRDTVQVAGPDLMFLSHEGLKGLGRTIQEDSLPINRLSGTITKDIISLIDAEDEFYRSVYHPEENFYLITFVGGQTTYCFDVRTTLEDGSYRVTRWPSTGFTCYESADDGSLRIGSSAGIGVYSGHQDDGQTYRMQYTSPELSLGDPAQVKFLKKLRPTMVGGSGKPIALRWAYNFGSSSGSAVITPLTSAKSEYNVAEFGVGEFSTGDLVIREAINTNGSGTTLSINIECDVDGLELSIQEINLLTLTGRLL